MRSLNPRRSRKNATHPFFAAALIGAAFLVNTTPANAQSICNKRIEMVTKLETEYQEFVTAIGMAGNGSIVELFVSDTGSWTLLLSQPNGISCLMAAGENWETIPIPVKGRAA